MANSRRYCSRCWSPPASAAPASAQRPSQLWRTASGRRRGWWPSAWFSWAGAAVSLGLLTEWQRQGVLRHPVDLARRLANLLGLSEPIGSVLSVPVDDAESVRSHLAAAGIKTAVRAGSVRLSPHV